MAGIVARRLVRLVGAGLVLSLVAFVSAQADDPLKTGTLRRGPDGKLYLDTSAPPAAQAAPPAAEPPAPATTPAQSPHIAPAAPVQAPHVALPAPVQPARSGPRTLAVCQDGFEFTSLALALKSAGNSDTITVGPGVYAEAGALQADKVTLRAKPGAYIKGVAAEGKGAIIVKGNDTVIEGLECSDIAVPDRNGACVRLEGKNLTLRKVHFHDAEEGLLTGPQTGTITIEDSVLERLGGNGGFSHAVYVGDTEALIIRRSAILSSRDEGHEVKSRAARTEIESSVIASMDGRDSRLIDVPNGGQLVVKNSVLEKGLNSSNNDVIGFGLEGVKHPVNSITLEGVTVIVDRKGGSLLNGQIGIQAIDLKVVGGNRPALSDYPWYPDRAAAGMGEYPAIPQLAGVPILQAAKAVNKRVCSFGCDYATLSQALREMPSGGTLSLGPGIYGDAGVLRANRVTIKAEPGAKLQGATVEGKAALVIKGDNTVIEGLECSGITVPDLNGACVRLEGKNLTLRKVNFHDSQEGLLANDDTGDIVIEDSLFERLGAGGRSHAIYVGKSQSLTVRRTVVLETHGKGHGVKTRTARTLIENSTIASLSGDDSRLIDISEGGEAVIRGSLLEKGPNSDNAEAIGYGLEGMPYKGNSLLIENCQLIMDRSPNAITRSSIHAEWRGGRLVGSDHNLAKEALGAVVGLIKPGKVGDNLSVDGSAQWFSDRAGAGLQPFPALPPR